ncbi:MULTISPECIES: TetR/AcrR family transcriptional regulator [Brachybacterium]|uniref:TetR/AcrR family transcriptional regulator n=1 Tax=Brachybacterium TaxID=43668 RepID=UPI0006B431B0|nr:MULTISPECIES: TetR/AcrR family transcriptional regulator [Brachybacterium]
MARPRMFDETAVLDAAVGQFRVHGYAGTSTDALCAAAGVRRSTLYNTFVSKDELFVRALERYLEVTQAVQEAVLEDEAQDVVGRLRAFLGLMVDEEVEAARAGHAAGCMVVGTRMTPDVSVRDERVERLLDRGLEHQLDMLAAVIARGQDEGALRGDVPAREGAALIVSLVSGMRVMAQAGTESAVLRRTMMLGLDGLVR